MFSRNDAYLRFFFKINPDELSDEKWAEVVEQMWYALEKTGTIEKKNGKIIFRHG